MNYKKIAPVPESPTYQRGDERKSFWGSRYGVSDNSLKKPRPKVRGVFILLIIILIAIFLRFYQLGQVPPSPDWDEAAIGYNAYSVLKTGRDEYGNFLPLTIRSFDDYKPPLYVYLTIPSIFLFDLNTWSVRLPSAIFGVLAVIGVYFLMQELFYQVSRDKKGVIVALVAALLLAVSPWHIQFSRIAFEANIGVTLNIWAVTFFLKGLRKNNFLWVSAFLFGLGFYAYHSQRIFIPLMLIFLGIIFKKELFSRLKIKTTIIALVIGIVMVVPLFSVVMNKSAFSRLSGTSSFSNQNQLLSRTIDKLEYEQEHGSRFGALLDNRRIVWLVTLVSGYLSHFSVNWLFLTGDIERHHAPDMGLMYLWELPFLLWGVYQVAITRGKLRSILLGWFLAAPIAAAPTTGLPHAVRTLVFLPVFQIFTAIGLVSFWERFQSIKGTQLNNILKKIGISLLILLFTFNFIYYLLMYFVHQNREVSQSWQYGYKQAVSFTEKNKDKYEKVIVSLNLEQPYMFFLFFTKYDPVKYLEEGGTKSGGFGEINRFDKYEFRDIDWVTEIKDGSILYVGAPGDIPHRINSISYLDGSPAIEIADRE